MKNTKHIGLAMSGGGARGIAHLGVLQALIERGYEPYALAGASMGAIVGCFYAAGFDPLFILEQIKKERLTKFLSWSLPGDGFLDLEYMEDLLNQYVGEDDFAVLKKPLYVSVSNLNSGEAEIISRGPLFRFIIASASIPVIFKPQIINGHMYVDGGLLRNLPARALSSECDLIIGVNVNLCEPVDKIEGLKQIVERCLRLGIECNMKDDLAACDMVINPVKIRAYNTFDFRKADEIFRIGYEEANMMIEKHHNLFSWKA